jgi:hypothetical protein
MKLSLCKQFINSGGKNFKVKSGIFQRFEVLTTVTMKTIIFWYVKPYSLIDGGDARYELGLDHKR